jgi:hypothetical protein
MQETSEWKRICRYCDRELESRQIASENLETGEAACFACAESLGYDPRHDRWNLPDEDG